MLSLRSSSQSLPHLSPISAITWLLPFWASSTSTSFPAFFSSLHLIERKKTDSSMPGTSLDHAEWHHPYQLTCSLKWPHSIPLPFVPC